MKFHKKEIYAVGKRKDVEDIYFQLAFKKYIGEY